MKAGERVGRWVLDKHLAQGGFGNTFLARHAETGRVAVVKIDSSTGSAERLFREQQALARLNLRGTPELLDVGHTADGHPYVVESFIDGIVLSELLSRQGRLQPRDAVAVARSLAGTMAEAHAAGIIHRDIKPQNVMIPRGPGDTLSFANAVLLDFGLLGYLTERDERGGMTTIAGAVMGTPRYMSPEQALGQRNSAASDVFSIAVVLSEMLSGHSVYGELSDLQHLMMKVVEGKPDPASLPAKPLWLRELLIRCLAREPAERPRDAGALLQELQAHDPQPLVTAGIVFKLDARIDSERPFVAASSRQSFVFSLLGYVFEALRERRYALLVMSFLTAASCALCFVVARSSGITMRAILGIAVLVLALTGARLVTLWATAVDATTPAAAFAHARNRVEAGNILSQSVALDVESLSQWAAERGAPRARERLAMVLNDYQQALSSGRFQDLDAAMKNLLDAVDVIRPWWVRSSSTVSRTVLTVGVLGSLAVIAAAIIAAR